jgi:hypothetical protein
MIRCVMYELCFMISGGVILYFFSMGVDTIGWPGPQSYARPRCWYIYERINGIAPFRSFTKSWKIDDARDWGGHDLQDVRAEAR